MLERTAERFGLKPERLAGDCAYGAAEMLHWLVEEQKIAPHVPVIDKSTCQDGTFSAAQGVTMSFGRTHDDFAANMSLAEILICNARVVLEHFPAEAPRLKFIFLTHAGVDVLAGADDRIPPGVVVLNNSGVHARKAAEYALMAVLAIANELPYFVERQRKQAWDKRVCTSVQGRRATIVGLGSIGSEIVEKFRALGIRNTGVRTRAEPHPCCDRVVATENIDSVLPDTDFLVMACPLTPRTVRMLDGRRIALLPKHAGVVNVGRGELIEQDALLDALDDKRLAGAVLDVFVPEPVPPNHRLWSTRNLLMTPHVSAADPTTYVGHSLDILFDNLRCHREGRPLPNEVDLTKGY
jgi:phosphoglycerate dehydrogenase-like enzyme